MDWALTAARGFRGQGEDLEGGTGSEGVASVGGGGATGGVDLGPGGGRGGPAVSLLGGERVGPAPRGRLPAPLGSMEEKLYAGPTTLMAVAACGTKAMSLFKRTLVLSPAAAPRGTGTAVGSAPRGCPLSPAAWPSKDWLRGEGVCGRLRSPPAAGRLPPSHSCSSASPTSVCLLCPQDSLSGSLKTCYKYLNQTSRSFAAVIEALDGEMR